MIIQRGDRVRLSDQAKYQFRAAGFDRHVELYGEAVGTVVDVAEDGEVWVSWRHGDHRVHPYSPESLEPAE